MKVLIISPYALDAENSNGVNKIIFNQITLNQARITYSLAAPSASDDIKDRINFFQLDLTSTDKSDISKFFRLTPTQFLTSNRLEVLIKFINGKIKEYDIIHLYTYPLSEVVAHLPEYFLKKIRVSLIDCHSLYFKRRSESESNLIKRNLLRAEAQRYLWYENKLKNYLVKIHFVSKVDAESFGADSKNVFVIENGVNGSVFRKLQDVEKHNSSTIIFFGNLSYGPNKQAIEFIIHHLAPFCLKEKKNYKFHIIGKDITTQELPPNVEYLGFIEDLNLEINKSHVAIFPLFYGSGIKNKVLEALSTGIKTICTSLSLEGIELNQESDQVFIVSGMDPERWANQISDALQLKETTNLSPFLNDYSWTQFTDKMLDFYS